MSKAIIVANRTGKDKNTGGDVRWVTIYMLPSSYTNKEGKPGLFYPKKEQALKTVCISKERNPDCFARLEGVLEGTVCVPRYAIDELRGELKFDSLDVVKDTNKHTPDILYKN